MDINRIYDRIDQCQSSEAPSFTDFLDYGELKNLHHRIKVPAGVMQLEFQGFGDDERRMVGYFPVSYKTFMSFQDMYSIFPLRKLTVEPRYSSDGMFLHKDLLGSILGLGLERRLFGDIIIKQRKAYILCHERAAKILTNELSQVGRLPVNIAVTAEDTSHLMPSFKEMNITVASMRLDSVVKACCNCSRGEVNRWIQQGNIKLNQVEACKTHKLLEEGDILSIRKKGKFKIHRVGELTRKGRVSVTIYKFV